MKKKLVVSIFILLVIMCSFSVALATRYTPKGPLEVPRIPQTRKKADGTYEGDCHICTLASIQAYMLGSHSFTPQKREHAGQLLTRTYNGAGDYLYNSDPVWWDLYAAFGYDNAPIYNSSLYPCPMTWQYNVSVSSLLEIAYSQLSRGVPLCVYRSVGPHASVIIGYRGNSDTLRAEDFTVMEIKPYGDGWKNSKALFNQYASNPSTTYSSRVEHCYVTLKAWLQGGSIKNVSYPTGTPALTALDVNGYLDGVDSGNLGSYGTFDITVGTSSLNDVNDYYTSHPRGTAYNITDIKANPGYDYLGVISGNLSGTISGSNTVNIRLSFATQGNLAVTGLLDGANESSISDYGSFDVYINGSPDEMNCTSYNKHWPNGTTYEIRNIQALSGKHFIGQAGYSGTITSRTESKVVLPYESDGFATTEWQIVNAVPANLDPSLLEIEYDNHYETVSSGNPGAGWVKGAVVSSEYVNSGAPYSSHVVLPTSETRVLLSYYYYHWCHSANNNANYEPTSTYYHYDEILDPSLVYVNNTLIDRIDSSYVIYNLKWKSTGEWAYCKSGTTCDGNYGTHSNRSYHWYRMDTYQDRVLVQTFKWSRDSGWTGTRDPNAASVKVRYRLKKPLTGNDITDITAPDSLSLMAGETVHVDVDVIPMFVGISTDELTFTIEDDNLFEIDAEHNIHCKDTYGTTSDTTLVISAPSGVTKTVSLTARTNVRNYSYLINSLPACAEPDTVDIYKVGQTVPYQVSYELFNDYDPGYSLVPAEGETGYTTDTAAGTLTFQAPTNPSGMSVALTLPESGYSIEYGNLLVTDDQRSMYLPSGLVQIEEEAFEGSSAKYFFLPGNVQSIGNDAFPAYSCVFLNTANLTNCDFADNGVWFIETGSGYNDAFAALHSNYLVPRGLTSCSAGEE